MHWFHHRFHRHERRHSHHGRLDAFWHAAFHRAHGFHGHDHDRHRGEAFPGRGRVPLRSRAAAFLDLDDVQIERLDRLFEQVCATRRSAKVVLRSAEFAALVEAFGDFFDALDFEQQQMLRFALRRRHGHNGRHDAPPAAD